VVVGVQLESSGRVGQPSSHRLLDWLTGRGSDSETERHLKLINRINDLITAADARGQTM